MPTLAERLEALEALEGRVSHIEKAIAGMCADLGALTSIMNGTMAEIRPVVEQLKRLAVANARGGFRRG